MTNSFIEDNSGSRFTAGLNMRKRVLGEAYVDRAIENVSELTAPLQRLVTEYCWGEVWNREELPPRDRSLLNIGMLIALNRPHELKLHLRGALKNGLSQTEIAEAILQSAIYCGVPAAIDAMRSFQLTLDDQPS